MAKKEAFLQFLKAARSLQDRGLSKEAIVQFAKNEFGELSELFKKQIDSLFKPKKGIENIKIKDPDFDDTVVKMQFDDAGVPFNPKDPLKTKSLTYEEAVAKEKARAAADEDYIMKIFDPEDFAKGGRAGYGLGSLVSRKVSATATPGSAPVNSGSGTGLGGMVANMIRNNPQMFTPVQNYAVSDNSILGPAAKSAASNIMEGQAKNQAALNIFNQSTPQVDARMNLDYDTLINQNEAQRNLQAQQRNPGIMRPTIADVAGSAYKPGFENYRFDFKNDDSPLKDKLLTDVIPDLDKFGNYLGDDPLLKDYAAAGRGTAYSNLTKLSADNPAAEYGAGYYTFNGTNFTKVADENPTSEYMKFLRSQYLPSNLQDINQTGMPKAITQDDMDTFNFTKSDPMMTGFDYSKEINWSPGQPAPDGYRVAEIMGDKFLERIYPSKQEIAGLPGMIGPMGPMPLGLAMPPSGDYRDLYREDPDAGLSGQEIAEKYGIEYAKGGRAGYYTGGMVDVEPNLSDIGHGSDALMARTRLVAPDSQATTSTGLNYLLAEDNDNIRVPFSKGKLADAARRKFMKTVGGIGAGIGALKTGLLGFGEKAAPVAKEVIETVSETAQGVPPYFLNLVNKIRKMGDNTIASKDKANAYKFKDYVMEEDFAGNIEIIKKGDDVAEDVYMSLKVDEVPLKGKKGSTKVEEYEEFTARPDAEGKMKDVEPGVPDEVVQEGTIFEDNMTEFGMTKKASGGIARMIGE
jgi:hypothetical protein